MKIYMGIFAALTLVCSCSVNGEKYDIKKAEATMEVHCIGRYIIALPVQFLPMPIVTGSFRERNLDRDQRAIEVIVNKSESSLRVFDRAVGKRRAEIVSASGEEINVLRSERRIGNSAVIFRVQELDDAYLSEMIVSRGGALVSLRLASYHNQYSSAEERLLRFYERIQENKASNEVGSEDGFCLGQVTMAGDYAVEAGDFLFRDQSGADFDVKIDSYVKDDKIGLLTRMAEPNSLLATFRVDHGVMRARKTILAGMQAEEWLGWTMQGRDASKKIFGFAMETHRQNPDKSTPKITISFDSGKEFSGQSVSNASITEERAIALWDSVMRSVSARRMAQQ